MNRNVFNVHQDEYIRSKINPISREAEYKNIHFNTKYRKDYYNSSSTNFQYDFPEPCNNVVSLKLSSICIPNSFYLFSSKKGNNRFIIEEVNSTTGLLEEVHEIVIPDGNYTASQLETYLNNTYFYNSSTSTFLQNIYFSIDTHSLKTTVDISGAGVSTSKANIKFVNNRNADNVMNTAGWIMGFRYGQYLNIGGSGRPSFLTSEGIYNVNEDCSFFFCVDDHNRNVNNPNIVFFQDSTMRNDVLAKIHLVDGKFTLENNIINDDGENHNKTRKFYGPVDIQKIHVRLIDQYGRLVDLNNMDFTFSLELTQLYNNI
jgi:hypothetical protein